MFQAFFLLGLQSEAALTESAGRYTGHNSGSEIEATIEGPAERRQLTAAMKNREWPNKTLYYSFEQSVSDVHKNNIRDALNALTTTVRDCVKFVEDNSAAVRVIVTNRNPGCSCAHTGYIGRSYNINLHGGCAEQRDVISHEFLHALGFIHTQKRRDRDEHISINLQNLQGDTSQYEKIGYGKTTGYGLGYDYGSIMHYGAEDNTKYIAQPVMLARDASHQWEFAQRTRTKGLSQGDINIVRVHYGCQAAPAGWSENDEIEPVPNVGTGAVMTSSLPGMEYYQVSVSSCNGANLLMDAGNVDECKLRCDEDVVCKGFQFGNYRCHMSPVRPELGLVPAPIESGCWARRAKVQSGSTGSPGPSPTPFQPNPMPAPTPTPFQPNPMPAPTPTIFSNPSLVPAVRQTPKPVPNVGTGEVMTSSLSGLEYYQVSVGGCRTDANNLRTDTNSVEVCKSWCDTEHDCAGFHLTNGSCWITFGHLESGLAPELDHVRTPSVSGCWARRAKVQSALQTRWLAEADLAPSKAAVPTN